MEGGSYGSLVEAGVQDVLEGEQQGLSVGGAAAFTPYSDD